MWRGGVHETGSTSGWILAPMLPHGAKRASILRANAPPSDSGDAAMRGRNERRRSIPGVPDHRPARQRSSTYSSTELAIKFGRPI